MYGVLPLLDEQCRLGDRGTDAALCESLNARNPACAAAVEALGQRGRIHFRLAETFTVDHFVQPVTYTGRDFLERNRDTFFGDLSRAMIASSNPLVTQLLPPSEVQTSAEVTARGTGRSYATVASAFVTDLGALLTELGATDAGFVRCIKPNAALAPGTFDASMVLHQLRTCGMVQAVSMMAQMYGARMPYTDILGGYLGGGGGGGGGGGAPPPSSALLLPESFATLSTPREAVERLCGAFDVPPHEYAFGATKLFLRAGQAVGLSAFIKPHLSAADRLARAVVLRWKCRLHARELAVGAALARWLRRVRCRLTDSEAAAAATELAFVAAAAAAAAGAAATAAAAAASAGPPATRLARRCSAHARYWSRWSRVA